MANIKNRFPKFKEKFEEAKSSGYVSEMGDEERQNRISSII